MEREREDEFFESELPSLHVHVACIIEPFQNPRSVPSPAKQFAEKLDSV
jgi:hypothetical protein